jgi:hypothetical protein
MRSSFRFGLAALAAASLAFSCGGDDHPDDEHAGAHPGGSEHAGGHHAGGEHAGGAHAAGNVECQELGLFCHDPGEIDAEAQECHELMHEAADGCLDRLEECRAICQAVIDATGSGGAGGSGASGAGSGGANNAAGAGGRN